MFGVDDSDHMCVAAGGDVISEVTWLYLGVGIHIPHCNYNTIDYGINQAFY